MDCLKRLMEIKKRRSELQTELRSLSGELLDKAIEEVDSLIEEEKNINKRLAESDEIEKRGNAIITTINNTTQNIEFDESTVISTPEYRSAFLKDLQGNKNQLTDLEKRALSTATNSVGAVIPTQTMNKVVEKLEQQGVIYPLVFSFNIPSNTKIPVEGETEEFSWVDEGTSPNDSNDKINEVSLGAMELIKTIEITAQVEAMSIDAFESFIVALLSRKARKAIDYAIINGTGDKQGTGILTALKDEITTIKGSDWGYDDIIKLKRSLKSGYCQNARFILSSDTLADIETIKDNNGNPIFKEESDKGFPTLSGKPVIIYDNVPYGTIIFGDFEYYYFNFVKTFEIAKDTSVGFKSAKTCYRALALCDCKPALNEAFVIKKKSQQ